MIPGCPLSRSQAGVVEEQVDEFSSTRQNRAYSMLAPASSSTELSVSREGYYAPLLYLIEAFRVPSRPPLLKHSRCKTSYPNPANPKPKPLFRDYTFQTHRPTSHTDHAVKSPLRTIQTILTSKISQRGTRQSQSSPPLAYCPPIAHHLLNHTQLTASYPRLIRPRRDR